MTLTALEMRRKVRALTDALDDGAWIAFPAVCDALPNVDRDQLAKVLLRMREAKQLVRRGGRRNYEYRSGPKPVTDGRTGNKTGRSNRVRHGFMELARLSETNPREYARLTRSDRGFKR